MRSRTILVDCGVFFTLGVQDFGLKFKMHILHLNVHAGVGLSCSLCRSCAGVNFSGRFRVDEGDYASCHNIGARWHWVDLGARLNRFSSEFLLTGFT